MPGTNAAGLNAAANAVADLITHVIAYEGDPDVAGVAVSAEVAVAFDAAAAGVASTSAAVDLAIGAGDTVDHMAYRDAVDAIVTSHVVVPEVFAGAGTYRLTQGDIGATG